MNIIAKEYIHKSGRKIQIVSGDITEEHVDGIVNAANAYLQHGGGVAGVISLNGGSQIQVESDRWIEEHGPVDHDSPAYTSGGDLGCRFVIHAVGPVWGTGNEDQKLSEAVSGSLMVGDKLGLNSIAFPAIATGIFGFPRERAAGIILNQFSKYFDEFPDSSLELVRMVLFDQDSLHTFIQAAADCYKIAKE
jgi:O-acetyl-ADP-ribose deacetylase (regulator of RNase III)